MSLYWFVGGIPLGSIKYNVQWHPYYQLLAWVCYVTLFKSWWSSHTLHLTTVFSLDFMSSKGINRKMISRYKGEADSLILKHCNVYLTLSSGSGSSSLSSAFLFTPRPSTPSLPSAEDWKKNTQRERWENKCCCSSGELFPCISVLFVSSSWF